MGDKVDISFARAQGKRTHFQSKCEVIHLWVYKFSVREGKNLLSRVKARAHLGIKASEMGILYSITHFLVKVDMAETMPSLGIKDSTQCKMQCERPMIQEGSSMSSTAKDGDAEFPEGQHCPSPT